MVKPSNSDDDHYDELAAAWPSERPSRRRRRRAARRRSNREITVRAVRRTHPDVSHMSRALLAAQREMAEAQADADARRQASDESEPKR